jgi:hypothetical protein
VIAVLPGQTGMFEEPLLPAIRPKPMEATITIHLQRLSRTKCHVCGFRRVCYVIAVGDRFVTLPCCAKDAGLR